MTKKTAIYLEEMKEEAAKEKAQLRSQAKKLGNPEGKEKNRVERDQEELAILLHKRKLKEERKEKKRQATLERARPKSAWDFPTIQRLGNQALASMKVTDDTKDPKTSQATVGDASEGTGHSRVRLK